MTAMVGQDINQGVKQIIAAQAFIDPNAVLDTHSLTDLGLDSLGMVEMIFAIEERFGIDVPFNANDPDAAGFDISTVGSVASAVQALIADQHR